MRGGSNGNAQIQASAAVQGTSEFSHLLEVGAGLGQDPQDSGALLVYVAVTAVANLPLGVAVICGPDAIRPPAT